MQSKQSIPANHTKHMSDHDNVYAKWETRTTGAKIKRSAYFYGHTHHHHTKQKASDTT